MEQMDFEEGREDPRAKSAKYNDQISVRFLKMPELILTRPNFIIDEDFLGEPDRVQVGLANINDNIQEKFLRDELFATFCKDKCKDNCKCIRLIQIVRGGPHNRHLGLAKIQMETPELAIRCVQHYNNRKLMGKHIVAELDVKYMNIEKKKEEALRPQTKPIIQPESVVSVQTPTRTTFPLTPVLPHTQSDVIRPANRLHAPGSLLERIAQMGLAPQGAFPTTPQPLLQPTQNNVTPRPQFRQNHLLERSEKKPMIEHTYPPKPPIFEEDEDAWNPPTSTIPEEIIHLTSDDIDREVLPFIVDEYLKELIKNIESTSRKQLLQSRGYPCLDKYSSDHRAELDRKEMERRMKERKTLDFQTLFGRQIKNSGNSNKGAQLHRRRTGVVEDARGRDETIPRRINRSAALTNDVELNTRRGSTGASEGSPSPRRSRSRSPHSRSGSRSDSSSSSAQSVSSLSSSSGSESSRSSSSGSSRSSSRGRESPFQIRVESSKALVKQGRLVDDKEETAANALLDLKRQPNALDRLEQQHSLQSVKKRKTKLLGQENRVIKRAKVSEAEPDADIKSSQDKKLKRLVKSPRSPAEIEKLEDELTFNDEDLRYLETVHKHYEDEQGHFEPGVRIPFGSATINVVHLMSQKSASSVDSEKKDGGHPKWWNGCSRCDDIPIRQEGWKVKVEETAYDESQKALIKSHVIQAANSTRRDQRNDQRRMITINSALAPTLLKQFTSNTLQMRAKNLRFSRSKIHMWGLFACERIAGGDAVIEYVGEKIRPSVADHRELVVYPKLVTHDGSSYFFRVDTDVIDATLKGNKARFINHSCNPNCFAKVINNNGTNSIVIYAKQQIEEDEEITYDYKFPLEDGDEMKIHCRCKAPNCQKYLN